MKLPTTVPEHLRDLAELYDNTFSEKATTPDFDAKKFDVIQSIVDLRNSAAHPKAQNYRRRSTRQWAESGFFVGNALLLGVLFVLEYRGPYIGLDFKGRGLGSGVRVPWAC